MTDRSTREPVADPDAVARALSDAPDWITPELLEKTLRTWQPYYEEPLIPEDALEIISSVGRLLDVLSGDSHETVCRSGTRK